jgi:copper chaperone CopZ
MSSTAIELQLSGLHCMACVGRVTRALEPLGEAVEVTLNPPRASLVPKVGTSADALIAAVAGAGKYTAQVVASAEVSAPAVDATSVADANPVASTARATHAAIGAAHAQPDRPAASIHTVEMPMERASSTSDSRTSASNGALQASWLETYKPLLLVFAFITVTACILNLRGGAWSWHGFMADFMAGFFLVFGFFKLLNVQAFADAYAGYDLVAQGWRAWGFIYPFVEVALGALYLTRAWPTFTLWATLVVMGISTLGVLRAVLDKKAIRCACLGTVFNLPISTVTLVEDLLMVAMAAWMLAA